MRKTPKRIVPKFSKGQVDHVDAWLMSYADMITLLFIVIVIAIPLNVNKKSEITDPQRGEPEHPYYVSNHTGLLSVNTTFDEAYRSLVGVIISNNADEDVSVEKGRNSVWLDISVPAIFDDNSADIKTGQITLIRSLITVIKNNISPKSTLVIEGYTDDKPLESRVFVNKWELSSMQTAKIAGLLIAGGIDSSRLRITSYAANSPLVPNNDFTGKPIEKNRIRNQRIVIRVEN